MGSVSVGIFLYLSGLAYLRNLNGICFIENLSLSAWFGIFTLVFFTSLFIIKIIYVTLHPLFGIYFVIFTPPWHSPAIKHKKTVAYIFQWKTLVTWRKIEIDFFNFLWGFHHFSIEKRIKVHFFSFALGNERTLVACKSLRSASLLKAEARLTVRRTIQLLDAPGGPFRPFRPGL